MRAAYSLKYLLIAILLVGTLRAQEKIEPPFLERQIEPDYPPDLKSFLIDLISIEILVDPEGIPFSLRSTAALTDNIVQALSEWRFRPARKNGEAIAFPITMPVAIHRPIGEMLGRMRRSWNVSKDLNEAFAAAQDLDEAKATKLEEEIGANPQIGYTRLILLAYGATTPGPAAAHMQLRQILWFARNTPRAEVLSTPLVIPYPPDPSGEALFAQIRQIWLTELAEHVSDPVVLDHATNFLRFSDPEVVEKATRQVIFANPSAEVLLGDLYGLAVLGVTAVDPKSGHALDAEKHLPTTPFAVQARSQLISTQNLSVFFSAASTVTEAGPSLAEAGHLPDGYLALCQELIERAKSYDPKTLLNCDATGAAFGVPPAPPTRIRVGGNVQQANRIKSVHPAYPPEAKSRGISGTIEFTAIIAKDGSVQTLIYLGGPLPLYKSAYDSVRLWRYKPTLFNGNPMEVVTRIDVTYTLN